MTRQAEEPHVGLVVEGRGDTMAAPALVRNILLQHDFHDVLGKPVCCLGRSNATREGGIEKFTSVATARPGCVGALVILDGDEDPICTLGPTLRDRAGSSSHGKPIQVVLAEPSFEEWIVASAETMPIGIAFDPTRHPVGVIKEGLGDVKYTKPTWQPRLASQISVEVASGRSESFRRLANRAVDLAALVDPAE